MKEEEERRAAESGEEARAPCRLGAPGYAAVWSVCLQAFISMHAASATPITLSSEG